MTLLVLGGTGDAKKLALRLYNRGVGLRYSIAGLVRSPDLPCEVLSGGFGRYGGLAEYIGREAISGILDATHPYAQKISETAVFAARRGNIPYIRFQRPAWQAQEGDWWIRCKDWPEIIRNLQTYRCPFFTVGQLSREVIDSLTEDQIPVIRTAVAHRLPLSTRFKLLEEIGPFSIEHELRILKHNRIDVLVSKNAGGTDTIAKLTAAKLLAIPVLLLERPVLEPASLEFNEMECCVEYCAGLIALGQ